MTIQSDLLAMRDNKLAGFNAKLMPGVPANKVIGIATPKLRKYAKTITAPDAFLDALPHEYFEENQVHAFLLSDIRDFEKCAEKVDKFLPFVDNWATCDQLIPRVFARNTDKLLPYIRRWIKSKHTFTTRFAIGALMRFYLGDKFNPEYADMVVKVKSDEYYINMMRAWYFATALAKNWDAVIDVIKTKQLDTWTHNKTIQKAIESYRISDAQKKYLRNLKII